MNEVLCFSRWKEQRRFAEKALAKLGAGKKGDIGILVTFFNVCS